MTKKLEELLNLPESQEIVQEEKAKAEAEDKKAEDKQQSLQAQKNTMRDICLLYTTPSPRDQVVSRMPSAA